jgi:hypothetical protein
MGETGNEQSPRRKVWFTATAIVTFFLSFGMIIGWFGLQDIARGMSYGVRLRAAAMVVDSLILLASAIAVVLVASRGWARAGNVALIGAAASAITGIILVCYQLVSGDHTLWLTIWYAMAILGAGISLFLLHVGARFPYPKQFLIAITLTSLVAVANFAYTVLYQPTADPTEAGIEVELGTPTFNPDRTVASFPMKISINASGQVGMNVLAATYSVVGRRGSIDGFDHKKEQMNLAIQSGRPAARRINVSGYDLIQADQFVRPGTTFMPGNSINVNRTFDLPLPTDYDAIGLSATAVIARRGDVIINEDIAQAPTYSWDTVQGTHLEETDLPKWLEESKGVDFVRYEVPITEASYLRKKTRQSWQGSVWWVLKDPTPEYPSGFYLTWRFAPKWSPWGILMRKMLIRQQLKKTIVWPLSGMA